MMKREKIIQVIYSVMDEEINSLPSRKEQLKKSEDTVLFGGSDGLDSLDLVNLIIGVEEEIGDAFETEIALADESAMSEENSPYKTVQTLANYIITLLEADSVD
jgi:acyl carrier protein